MADVKLVKLIVSGLAGSRSLPATVLHRTQSPRICLGCSIQWPWIFLSQQSYWVIIVIFSIICSNLIFLRCIFCFNILVSPPHFSVTFNNLVQRNFFRIIKFKTTDFCCSDLIKSNHFVKLSSVSRWEKCSQSNLQKSTARTKIN